MPTAEKRRSTLADDAGTPRLAKILQSHHLKVGELCLIGEPPVADDRLGVGLLDLELFHLEVRGELVSIFLLCSGSSPSSESSSDESAMKPLVDVLLRLAAGLEAARSGRSRRCSTWS